MLTGKAQGAGGFSSVETDPDFASVTLLLKDSFTDLSDDARSCTTNVVGTPEYQTGNAYSGTASIDFDGSEGFEVEGGAMLLPTEDFTFECWVYPTSINSTGTTNLICGQYGSSANTGRMIFGFQSSNQLVLRINGGTIYLSYTGISTNTWYHIAWTHDDSANTHYLFVDGILRDSGSIPALYTGRDTAIGCEVSGLSTSYSFVGQMDSIRVTKGVCRYTSNFTVPDPDFPEF